MTTDTRTLTLEPKRQTGVYIERLGQMIRQQFKAALRHRENQDDFRLFLALYEAERAAPPDWWLLDHQNDAVIRAVWEDERKRLGLPLATGAPPVVDASDMT